MAIFPTSPTARINGSGTDKEYLIIESKFENGFSQTRRGSTKAIQTFSLSYDAITFAEYAILEAFFDANVGGNFTFTHPQTGVTHTVKFSNGKMGQKYISNQRVNCSIELVSV